MKGFVLSTEQLSELKIAHRKAKRSNAHAAYKINAVILLGTGWTLTQVKQALLLDEETLRSYVKKYREKGIERPIIRDALQALPKHKKINSGKHSTLRSI